MPPVGYILFKNGVPAYAILTCFAVSDFLNRVIQFILLRVQFRFDVFRFLRHAYFRPLVISILMGGYLLLYRTVTLTGPWQHLAGFLATGLVTAAVIGFVGFNREERRKAIGFIRKKLQTTSPA